LNEFPHTKTQFLQIFTLKDVSMRVVEIIEGNICDRREAKCIFLYIDTVFFLIDGYLT